MKVLKKGAIVMMMAMALGVTASAQDKVEGSISADVVSQYIWRGQDLGDVSFQPSLGLEYKGLSLSAWGSIGLSEPSDTREFDLTLAYTVGGFNIGITDYWFDSEGGKYFLYDAHKTAHVFEANVGYDFGPVAIQWYTNFAGADGTNSDGDRAYSSYVEVSAPFTLGGLDWSFAIGATPWENTFYGSNGFEVINVSLFASKDINITPTFSVPVFAGIATNPSSEGAHFVFGFTLKP